MKQSKVFSFFVLFLSFSSIESAPVSETSSLYDTISKDKRFGRILGEKFLIECKNVSPICVALIDVTLRFNEANLEFKKIESQYDDGFCDTKLLKILPDTPSMNETSLFMKSYNLTWFKDNIKQNDGKMCSEQCMYDSFDDYSRKVKPVCVFIYDQYKLLDAKTTTTENEIKADKKESISVEQIQAQKSNDIQNQSTSIMSEAGTFIDVIEARKLVTTQNVTVNKTDATVDQEQTKVLFNETKKVDDIPLQVTSTVAAVSKVDTAQIKADSKTTNINLDDQQSSLTDNAIFDQTQAPDNDDNGNLDNIDGGINGDDDEDDMYALDVPLRDNNMNGNKFQQEQLTDIEPHDNDSPQAVKPAFEEDPDSNFFTYLCIVMFLTIVLYVLYHNRQKILALLLEGRQGRNSRRPRSRGGSKAAYSKLDCNLEEAITSKKSLSGKTMDIIY